MPIKKRPQIAPTHDGQQLALLVEGPEQRAYEVTRRRGTTLSTASLIRALQSRLRYASRNVTALASSARYPWPPLHGATRADGSQLAPWRATA
jgi:hypothetical protein